MPKPKTPEQIRHEGELAYVLANPKGRGYLLRVMERCGVWSNPWDASARIHFNAGRQRAGQEIREEIEALGPEHWLAIERLRLTAKETESDEDETDD